VAYCTGYSLGGVISALSLFFEHENKERVVIDKIK
jgi:hypothetical protein